MVGELRKLVSDHPLKERLHGQLMVALYRSGRQAEALDVYREAQSVLRHELGVEPGPQLRQLEKAILTQDAALAPPAREKRPPLATQERPPRLEPPTRAAATARRRRRRRRRKTVLVACVVVLAGAASVLYFIRATGPAVRTEPDTVVALDPANARVVEAVHVGKEPESVVVGNGQVWVLNRDDWTISRVVPETGEEVARVGGVGTPTGVGAGDGGLWLTDPFGGTVHRIDARTNSVSLFADHLDAPVGIAVAFHSAWVTNQIDDEVLRMDLSTGRVLSTIRLPAGSRPGAIAAGNGSIWVADTHTRGITRIDPGTGQVVAARIPLSRRPDAVVAGNGVVWVTSTEGDAVYRIDADTESVSVFRHCDGPSAAVIDSNGAWVSCSLESSIAHIDGEGRVLSRVPVPGHPMGMSRSGGMIWVALGE
jgi:streptogramin lyase